MKIKKQDRKSKPKPTKQQKPKPKQKQKKHTHPSLSNTLGSMHTTAFARTCSLSNSARVRTSMTSTLWSRRYACSSRGNAVFFTGIGVFAFGGPLAEPLLLLLLLLVMPLDSPEGLCGAVDLPMLLGLLFMGLGLGDGDGGRLEKLWLVGVTGVLDGRSMGTVKFRNDARGDGDSSPLRSCSLPPPPPPLPPYGLLFAMPLPLLLEPGMPVGTDGSANAGYSSSSSMDGNAWLNPETEIS